MLEVMPASADLATTRAEKPQNCTDHYENATDRRQQGDSDQQADDEQNSAKENHFSSDLYEYSMGTGPSSRLTSTTPRTPPAQHVPGENRAVMPSATVGFLSCHLRVPRSWPPKRACPAESLFLVPLRLHQAVPRRCRTPRPRPPPAPRPRRRTRRRSPRGPRHLCGTPRLGASSGAESPAECTRRFVGSGYSKCAHPIPGTVRRIAGARVSALGPGANEPGATTGAERCGRPSSGRIPTAGKARRRRGPN